MRRRSGTVLDQETLAKLNESGANEIAAALVQQMWRRREVVRNASGSSQGGCTRAPRLQARCEARAKGLVGVVASEFAPAAPRFLRWIVVNTTRRRLSIYTRENDHERGIAPKGMVSRLDAYTVIKCRNATGGGFALALLPKRALAREGDGGSSSGDSCGATPVGTPLRTPTRARAMTNDNHNEKSWYISGPSAQKTQEFFRVLSLAGAAPLDATELPRKAGVLARMKTSPGFRSQRATVAPGGAFSPRPISAPHHDTESPRDATPELL